MRSEPVEPVGSSEWLEQTGGILTRRQRRRLTAQVAREFPQFVAHRTMAEWWRRRPSRGRLEFDFERSPTSRFAVDSRDECRDVLSHAMVNHSYRTWAFGHALAEVDNETLDCEIFFAAAMLHDVGLANPTYGRCFTDTGATAAARLGTTAEEREVTASAVRHHITPGLDASQGGLHGLYLQRGALLDLSGVRAFHLPVQFVKAVCERWPMLDGHVEASARWRAESALVKGGRAHHLQTRSRFSLVARCTPIPP